MADLLEVDRAKAVLGEWTGGPGPLYQQLAGRLRAAIENGAIPGGVRLPPERDLARALQVSRSTVAAAMAALDDAQLIERVQGSGTYVRVRRRPPDEGRRELVQELDEHALLRDLSGRPQATIDLIAAAVDCAREVVQVATTLDELTVERWTRGHGYVPLGLLPLREEIARYLTDQGLPTSLDQVMVTAGANEAVLLATRLYVEPGDPVAVESPSYVGALDVLRSLGGRLLSVEVDRHGARPDQLADLMARSLPRLVYLVPDFHNPTGAVLGADRRREVARLAREYHVPVIEDLVQRDLWFDAPPPAPIASFDPSAPILTIGSVSKVFWGGLRIGWVRADPVTIERLGRIKSVTNFGTPVIDQLVAARLLPGIAEVAARRRRELGDRLAVLEDALASHLPSWRWQRPRGGLVLWPQLPAPRAAELVALAEQRGVAAVPGTTFAVAPREHRDRLRVPYTADPQVLQDGVARLAAAWTELGERDTRQEPRAVVV